MLAMRLFGRKFKVRKFFRCNPVLVIGLSFALIIIMMISLVVLSISQMSALHTQLENLITFHNAKIEQVQTLRYVMRERMLAMHQLVIEDDPFKRDELGMNFASMANRFVEAISELKRLAETEEERGLIEELRLLGITGSYIQSSVVDLLNKDKVAAAKKMLKEQGMPAQLKVLHQAENVLAYYKRVASDVETETLAVKRNTVLKLIILGGLLSVVSLFTAMMVVRRTKADREDLTVAAAAFETRDGIMIANEKNVILRVNHAFTDITGYTAKEAIGKLPGMLNSGQQDEFFFARLWDKVNREGTWQGEIFNRYKNGEVHPNWLTITAVKKEDGTIANYVAMIADITERKQIEFNLIQAKEEAEKANNAKNQFISSMSHELRTPLNAILGFGQLLKLSGDSLGQEQRESINYILSAGQQLLGLINEILDLSRMEAGKMELKIRSLCIADITLSCIDQVAVAMGDKKNIKFENLITDTGETVLGDELHVRQVLINLLGNAVKYNVDNGHVSVRSVIETKGMLRIEVRDTGLGIASDKQTLLFMPFERIDQKHGTIAGVGIGLYISKQLVEAMQGTIGVYSEQEKGSTFWFDLPLADEPSEVKAVDERAQYPQLQAQSRFVVLLVEDNHLNVLLIQKALHSRPGIELIVTGTAEECLDRVKEVRPGLILMDIDLPGIDGITATSILKGMDATRNIPVVALSAKAMATDIDLALNSGCDAYLTKPLQLQSLYEVIDKVRQANGDAHE